MTLIVKLDGKYLLWCKSADAPASWGMTLDQLVAHTREELGRQGVEQLEKRLARVEAKGTSSLVDDSADESIWLNRAGPKESSLHRDEIIHFYVARAEPLTTKTLAAFRAGLPRCGAACVQRPDANGCASWCKFCWGTDFVRGES